MTTLIRRMNVYIYKRHREIRTRCRTGWSALTNKLKSYRGCPSSILTSSTAFVPHKKSLWPLGHPATNACSGKL